ncbi:MAG: pyridoxal phosphate-dependent aminotransferase [Chitinophagaceae bacterium]|nr:pyridoxal phosphate-dependent aminotransferase [Chitinophagaceae bacterium]
MKLSSRLQKFNEPETLKMAKLGRELRAKGIDVIDLSLGEPDFDTPDHVKQFAKKAIDDNYSHYTPVAGYADLREAVCIKLKRDNNLDYKPENILASTGAKQSLANVIMAVVDVDDEVIIPTPFWVTYSELVRLSDGKPVFIQSSIESNYKITPQQLEAAITPKTKLFMFSSPCNPSGSVYSREELKGLADVFRKHPDILIISDEIYEYINYKGQHESIAQFSDIKDRVIVVNGLSKGFAMTGWRLGYIAADPAIVKGCEKLQGQITSATCSITQRAAIAALTGDLTASQDMLKAFTDRRKRILGLLKEIPGVQCAEPDGAFYVFPKVDAYFGKKHGDTVIANADDLCMFLLNTAHVSTVTGTAFGEPTCIRISFANSMTNIEKALERIKKALLALQ